MNRVRNQHKMQQPESWMHYPVRFLAGLCLLFLVLVSGGAAWATPAMVHHATPLLTAEEAGQPAQAMLMPANLDAGRPRPFALRRRGALPPALRSAPRPPRQRAEGRVPAAGADVRITPSEALRLARQRWPQSTALSVRLLKGVPPAYLVRLRAAGRVFQVQVDARTGRILR